MAKAAIKHARKLKEEAEGREAGADGSKGDAAASEVGRTADEDAGGERGEKSRVRFARPPEIERDLESGGGGGGGEDAKGKAGSACTCEACGCSKGGDKDKGGDGKDKDKDKEKPKRPPRKWMKALGVKHEDEHQTLKNLGGRWGAVVCGAGGHPCNSDQHAQLAN